MPGLLLEPTAGPLCLPPSRCGGTTSAKLSGGSARFPSLWGVQMELQSHSQKAWSSEAWCPPGQAAHHTNSNLIQPIQIQLAAANSGRVSPGAWAGLGAVGDDALLLHPQIHKWTPPSVHNLGQFPSCLSLVSSCVKPDSCRTCVKVCTTCVALCCG